MNSQTDTDSIWVALRSWCRCIRLMTGAVVIPWTIEPTKAKLASRPWAI